MSEKCWMTVARAAVWLDVSDKTVRRWIASGRLRGAVNVGGQGTSADIRIPASSLDELMRSMPAAAPLDAPVFARTEGELRRKVAA